MLVIPLVLSIVLFVAALSFGLWAFVGRSDYKNNSDQKAQAAVKVAVQQAETKKDNEFLEREKNPLREYKGPAVFGSITFSYPKTWSGYLTDSADRMQLLMNPELVSGNQKSVYALKVTVETGNYQDNLKKYEANVKSGTARASAFRLEKVPSVLGSRIDGEIAQGVKGAAVVLPLRDKTMVISTESEDFINDFNTIILPSYTYIP